MSEYVWTRTEAKHLRPGMTVRDVNHPNDPPLKVVAVSFPFLSVYVFVWFEHQRDYIAFNEDAPFELRMTVDEFLDFEDARAEAREADDAA